MIIAVYKPIKNKKEVIGYSILSIENLYDKGSQKYKVSYRCDESNCKNPKRIYNITREHLSEHRSKTVNEKVQICRSCQTKGTKNPRFGDRRTWTELFDEEKVNSMKNSLSIRSSGDKNPSRRDSVKKKKGQIIINFENVSEHVSKFDLKLMSIDGDNKFSEIKLECSKGHDFSVKWANFKGLCKYCYFESIRIPNDKIKKFKIYSKKVRSLTRFNFSRNIHQIENSTLKINDSNSYHIDHIYSVIDGFLNSVNPEIIASYHNLKVISKEENLKKGRKSDITLVELLLKINS